MTLLRRTILISVALLLGSTAAAFAGGDLLMPPPSGYDQPIPAYSEIPLASHRRVYLRGDIGWGVHDDPEIIEGQLTDLTDEEIDGTFTVGVGIGRYFSPNIRGDITVDYRTDAAVTAYKPAGNGFLDDTRRKHDLSSLVVLANLYYDFASYTAGGSKYNLIRTSRFTPYVGVGLGFVTHWSDDGTFSGCCTGTVGSATETDVAAAFMAGVAINVRQHWKMDAGYRFLYMGGFETGDVVSSTGGKAGPHKVEDLHAHEFRLGLRYDWR